MADTTDGGGSGMPDAASRCAEGHSSSQSRTRELNREALLDRALESGITELPENRPKGWLGESNIDLRKTEEFAPDLNSGLSQDNDTPVIWLAVILGYLLGFVPGFVILWASRRFTTRQKSIVSAAGVVLAIAIVMALKARG